MAGKLETEPSQAATIRNRGHFCELEWMDGRRAIVFISDLERLPTEQSGSRLVRLTRSCFINTADPNHHTPARAGVRMEFLVA